MAYSVVSKKSGKTYYLHLREQKRKDGNVTKLYFFVSKTVRSTHCLTIKKLSKMKEQGFPF